MQTRSYLRVSTFKNLKSEKIFGFTKSLRNKMYNKGKEK